MLCDRFNEMANELSGFSPRSPQLWQEIYNEEETHLLIAKEDNKLLGYLIVTPHNYATARIATISELCVWERKQEITSVLLNEAAVLAKNMQATALVSWEGSEDKINQALAQFGFFNIGRSVFSIGETSVDFIKKILESNNTQTSAKNAGNPKDILVDLGRKRLMAYSATFTTRINADGTVSTLEDKTVKPYATIQTDIVTYTEIILSLSNPYAALLTGKIRIKPATKALAVVKLLRKHARPVDWYLPLGDYF